MCIITVLACPEVRDFVDKIKELPLQADGPVRHVQTGPRHRQTDRYIATTVAFLTLSGLDDAVISPTSPTLRNPTDRSSAHFRWVTCIVDRKELRTSSESKEKTHYFPIMPFRKPLISKNASPQSSAVQTSDHSTRARTHRLFQALQAAHQSGGQEGSGKRPQR